MTFMQKINERFQEGRFTSMALSGEKELKWPATTDSKLAMTIQKTKDFVSAYQVENPTLSGLVRAAAPDVPLIGRYGDPRTDALIVSPYGEYDRRESCYDTMLFVLCRTSGRTSAVFQKRPISATGEEEWSQPLYIQVAKDVALSARVRKNIGLVVSVECGESEMNRIKSVAPDVPVLITDARTLESVARAVQIFGEKSIILPSSEFLTPDPLMDLNVMISKVLSPTKPAPA